MASLFNQITAFFGATLFSLHCVSCVVLLPYLWQDNQAGKQSEQTHEKTSGKKPKKASLRSQGGGFTPQLDNTHQICEDSKS